MDIRPRSKNSCKRSFRKTPASSMDRTWRHDAILRELAHGGLELQFFFGEYRERVRHALIIG